MERELEYFRKNRLRMRYRALKDRNLPVGTGVVEAANKQVGTKGKGRHRKLSQQQRQHETGLPVQDIPRPDKSKAPIP